MDFLPRLVRVLQAGLLELSCASLTSLEISQGQGPGCSRMDLPWLRCWRDLGQHRAVNPCLPPPNPACCLELQQKFCWKQRKWQNSREPGAHPARVRKQGKRQQGVLTSLCKWQKT